MHISQLQETDYYPIKVKKKCLFNAIVKLLAILPIVSSLVVLVL